MPKFQRISLLGSDELFRPTKLDSDDDLSRPAPRPAPAPADAIAGQRQAPLPPAPTPAPLTSDRAYHRLHLSEHQIRQLIDGVQRMKYPHHAKLEKPSIEEFEQLEALRSVLLDALE